MPPFAVAFATCSLVRASPVPTSEITTDFPSDKAASVSAITLGTLKAQITCRKNRWWSPQNLLSATARARGPPFVTCRAASMLRSTLCQAAAARSYISRCCRVSRWMRSRYSTAFPLCGHTPKEIEPDRYIPSAFISRLTISMAPTPPDSISCMNSWKPPGKLVPIPHKPSLVI